jgi:UDP-N-acetylglucosamine:LPS N-acetylglucosamine transferase
MANMSYCRFENTAKDIADCIEALNENNWDIEQMMENASSAYEKRGMKQFIKLCKEVAENFD